MTDHLRIGRRPPGPLLAAADAAPGEMGPPPDLRDWLAVVRRHFRLAAGVAAVVLGVAVYLTYAAPTVYRATSVVRLVDARRALAGGLVDGAGAEEALPSANPVLSQVEVLRSRATARAVVDDMPILRIRTQRFPVSLVTDVRLAPQVGRDSILLRFGRQSVTVQAPTGEREVPYGATIVAP